MPRTSPRPLRQRPLLRRALRPAFVFASAFTVLSATANVRADYQPPQKSEDEEPEVDPEGAPPKPGKRKFYVVEVVEEEAPPTRKVTIVFEPLNLLYPIYSGALEVAIAREFGVSVFGGAGKVTTDTPAGVPNDKASVAQFGVKGVYYAQGDFDGGLHVGLEALYTNAKLDGPATIDSQAMVAGLVVGPLVGWKLVTRSSSRARGSPSSRRSASASWRVEKRRTKAPPRRTCPRCSSGAWGLAGPFRSASPPADFSYPLRRTGRHPSDFSYRLRDLRWIRCPRPRHLGADQTEAELPVRRDDATAAADDRLPTGSIGRR
jgi:hypothetical protein